MSKTFPTETKPLTLDDARKLDGSFVYGLCDMDGRIFYVGQTRSARTRFPAHRQGLTGNPRLKQRLRDLGSDLRVVVLWMDPADLNAAERAMIAKYIDQIVNLVGADHWVWSKHSDVPWAAGSGVMCPSAYALKVSPESIKRSVHARRRAMTVEERCAFEINLLANFPAAFRKKFDRWLAITGPKIAPVFGLAPA